MTALGSRVYDNIYSEEQNVGSQDEGDFKAIQFVNETATESKDVVIFKWFYVVSFYFIKIKKHRTSWV